MLRSRFVEGLAAMLLMLGSAAGQSDNFTYTTLDHSSAKCAKSTSASGINARGDIFGSYTDSANVAHGFLLKDGNYITIDYPGAVATQATGINPQGDIVGTHQGPLPHDTGLRRDIHGYLLKDGAFKAIDYPGHLNTITQLFQKSCETLLIRPDLCGRVLTIERLKNLPFGRAHRQITTNSGRPRMKPGRLPSFRATISTSAARRGGHSQYSAVFMLYRPEGSVSRLNRRRGMRLQLEQ